jgi:hypothetical protein
MEANYKMGVSTRGLGDLVERNGTKFVNNYQMHAIDAVDQPSGKGCYVNALHESTEWVEVNGMWMQRPLTEAVQFDENDFLNRLDKFIEQIKRK